MIHVKIAFKSKKIDYKNGLEEYIENLLSSYYSNGQVLDYFLQGYEILSNEVRISVIVPERESLDVKFDNSYVREWKDRLFNDFQIKVSSMCINNIDDTLNYKKEVETDLILFSSITSPLRTINDFSVVPLYRLPYTSIDGLSYQNIKWWEKDYSDCFSLWMRGYIRERLLTNELTKVNSSLSKEGVDICQKISNLTRRRCYYYLFRTEPTKLNRENKCPSCGNKWLLPSLVFDKFSYRCDKCLIIS